MDFDSVLSIATQNQGLSNVPKRYSLKTGPPSKDVKVKGVNSAAVQAFLKKQTVEQKKKELQSKKAKEELLAKRVELKSDRKARAMASRTKDNFRGYNGIPVIDQPKKRSSKGDTTEEQQSLNSYDDDDDGDNYGCEGTDSESEEQIMPVKPPFQAESSNKVDSKPKKNSAPVRPPPASMNFADLLKLAEKKQFEPVEMKVVKKTEERLRTAEEIREIEMERRVKNQDRGKDAKPDKISRHKSSSNSQKKSVDRDGKNEKLHKPSGEKYQSSSTSKKPKLQAFSERTPSSAKLHGDRNSGSSGALNGKAAMKNGVSFQSKKAPSRPSQGQRPTTSSDLIPKKGNISVPQGKSSISGSRTGVAPGAARPGQEPHKNSGQGRPSNSDRGGQPPKQARPGHSSRPGSNGLVRPSSGDPSKQPRPGGSLQAQLVPGSSKASINGPSRMGGGISGSPLNGMGSGPGRPQCTVISETISSKNFAPKPGMVPRPLGPQGPKTVVGPLGHRILVRPPGKGCGPALPPITSNYKRKYEDEEDLDSEMDDFIDDEGEDQDEISKHIREIFGYDKSKYKDESDYALKFMESSWKEQQKEEARSLRLAVYEDQEEEKQELEEMRRKNAKKRK
ncbi:protein SPT2 homolog isoform X3 [Sinocyclocheilus anshuiensis]|uniref:protein SPT2 homolog isoform X3 n=1 Tax=Sinocyclocheilus anshuiensis TaxID=1608454 RepID=UPI0007B94E8B|nr:PREDICTED: protein SPT2 homolog isoform X3 [Sinocyclocheilus anshuiensis]